MFPRSCFKYNQADLLYRHRMVSAEKDIKAPPVPTPHAMGRDTSHQMRMGQPQLLTTSEKVPVPHHHHCEDFLPNI